MSAASKAKGTRYERELTDWLSTMFDTQRLPRAGSKDEGDIEIRFERFRLTIEAKNQKQFTPSEFLRQADVEADNREEKLGDTACIPVVFSKRRGANVKNSYVLMDAEEFTLLLKMAGLK